MTVTKNTAIGDIAHLPQVQAIMEAMMQGLGQDIDLGEGNMFAEMLKYMPLRAIDTFNPEGKGKVAESIIEQLNK